MLTGLPPYYDENTNDMYRKILSEPLHFPGPDIVPPAAKDLLEKLLDRRPSERLGANGPSEIKAHHFFANIDWRKLLQRKYDPTFKPSVVSVASMHCLDMGFVDRHRLMPGIRPTLTASSPRKPRPTRTWMVQCSRRRCSSSSRAGPTIALWQV